MAPILLIWGRGTGVGGTETRMAEVVEYWKGCGHRTVSVVLSRNVASPLVLLLERNGSEVVAAPTLRKLAAALRSLRPSLILVFGLRASLAVRALRLVGLVRHGGWSSPLVDARNGLEAGRKQVTWLLDRLTQPLVDVFLTNSDAAAANLRAHGIAERRIRILYSALGPAWHGVMVPADRVPGSVVMIGNARPEKQQALGLEVFAQLPEGTEMTVVTNDAAALREQWRQLSSVALGRVEFREGHSIVPGDLYRTAIILHPSSHESAPRCLMEARACGCHVVAFEVGDTRRIVGDGGAVVPAADVDGLRHALTRAVQSSQAGTLPHEPTRYPSVAEYASNLSRLSEFR